MFSKSATAKKELLLTLKLQTCAPSQKLVLKSLPMCLFEHLSSQKTNSNEGYPQKHEKTQIILSTTPLLKPSAPPNLFSLLKILFLINMPFSFTMLYIRPTSTCNIKQTPNVTPQVARLLLLDLESDLFICSMQKLRHAPL